MKKKDKLMKSSLKKKKVVKIAFAEIYRKFPSVETHNTENPMRI